MTIEAGQRANAKLTCEPFNLDAINRVRRRDGARWDKRYKLWRLPTRHVPDLADELESAGFLVSLVWARPQ